ncbi:single-stranded DNA-binding protein [Planctomycetes bacterium K23_9]|uniref:Single-stranded DNA-binding protein n=1 Tax=Stieleria marina TaxID=1930275 RepID=A0A517NXI3_9BACT|nr:Single-stranded DNA-binding protein [Planctomycetes bacterium K23_9]
MASYNRVILVGNITRDIELKYTQGGTAVTDVGLAVNDRRKTATGEWIDETTFVDVTLWGRTAEVASEYLGKGSPILIEGRLKLDTWETEGQKRSKLRVVCDRMQMLSGSGAGGGSGKPRNEGSQPTQQSGGGQPSGESFDQGGENPPGQREAQPTGGGAGYDDPDIPF